jgi:hypothetical protein
MFLFFSDSTLIRDFFYTQSMYERAQLMFWLSSGTNQVELYALSLLHNFDNLITCSVSKVWPYKLFVMQAGTVSDSGQILRIPEL